jgi:beta-1,2-mannobiose phosphorylase / 1,2-beta-oligomannan phosphorylase
VNYSNQAGRNFTMLKLTRHPDNPLLSPGRHDWDKTATFNGSVAKSADTFHMVYRALSDKREVNGSRLQLSTVGHAISHDGIHFSEHTQLLKPEHDWEKFGCEDPRITKFEDTFYIFYTALSVFPFAARGIKTALATTKDFKTFEKRCLVTPFNAKAMSLFPERINGKMAVLLTANTDLPPAKIGIAYFDREEELCSETYWNNWYSYVDDHTLSLQRSDTDHVEIGAPPIKTKDGWLLLYSHINNYYSEEKVFTIEALLLDPHNPKKILGRTELPLLHPESEYELYGYVPNIVFPSGALIQNNTLHVYYGGADTVTCLATCPLDELMEQIRPDTKIHFVPSRDEQMQLERFSENPILRPIPQHPWESEYVFNPAALYEKGKVYIIYRAMGKNNTSVFGLAISEDGLHIDERLPEPIYVPREPFEISNDHNYSGCEDPRIVRIDDTYHMCYTAYDGTNPPRVALTSITVDDFLNRKWDNWTKPKLISPPGIDDKDACLLPKKVDGQYMFFHRLVPNIWVDFVDDLEFKNDKFLKGQVLLEPRANRWDKDKIGISGPPLETKEGWLLLYHGIGDGGVYKTGAVLLAHHNPMHILAGTNEAILAPELSWEKIGHVNNVVFPCGNVIINDILYVYYGGADSVVGVARIPLKKLLYALTHQ